MSFLNSLSFGQYLRPNGQSTDAEAPNTESQANTTTNGQGHGRDASGRSMLSAISVRLNNMQERERSTERNRQGRRVQSRRDRLLGDLNRLRDVATGRAPFQGAGFDPDLEAQRAAIVAESTSRRGNATVGKTRREKEEGAALFGPNLANYFGSGSSSSGAVASSLPTGIETSSNTISIGSQRKSRLGSRGRARGASLSGLNTLDLTSEHSETSAAFSLSDQNAGELKSMTGETMTMAEGIELDTIKRWIDRSVVGGALEIPGVDASSAPSGDAGNPLTLCSTLQSYVNLKRNTVKLNVVSEEDVSSSMPTSSTIMKQNAALRSVTSLGQSNQVSQKPVSTHLLQFEYDCAAPNANIQVFVRASRKHGSWVAYTSGRENAGLPLDLSAGEDAETKFFAQRGPPPHVLGWPVHASRLRKGFGKTLKASFALELELYAPPKVDPLSKRMDEATGNAEAEAREAETPALDVSKRLGEEAVAAPTVDAAGPLQDSLNKRIAPPINESKEAKAAREKAERETLKVTIVVEALDEDGKPLPEPNLQTTYLRVASLPMRIQNDEAIVDAANIIDDQGQGGSIQDVALPNEMEEGKEVLASSTITQAKRIWSVQIEGQEAEIGPHRFQLQELYGFSSRPPPASSTQEDDKTEGDGIEGFDGDAEGLTPAPVVVNFDSLQQDGGATECLICLSAPPTTLLLPCTHGLCLECAVQLRDSVKSVRETERRRGRRPKRKYACPVCRRAYTNMLNLSTADEKNLAQATAAN
ncbi:hypothetical protein CBS101457_000486 [Exobasidium rhododendri]|nr:hypothetical protein CBS101457_000486 [Exobasidium rhododendri]